MLLKLKLSVFRHDVESFSLSEHEHMLAFLAFSGWNFPVLLLFV
jgi:hypothetical protein